MKVLTDYLTSINATYTLALVGDNRFLEWHWANGLTTSSVNAIKDHLRALLSGSLIHFETGESSTAHPGVYIGWLYFTKVDNL